MEAPAPAPPQPLLHRSTRDDLLLYGSNHITRVQFDSPELASQVYISLNKCRGEQIVNCLGVHGSEVLIERTGCTVQQLFLVNLNYWRSLDPTTRVSWWLHIQRMFFSVFRNIMRGLSHAYSFRCFSGRLVREGVSIVETKTKLSFLQDGGVGFEAGVQRDLHDLRSLMINALLVHREPEDRLPIHFRADGIPEELVAFIETLSHVNNFQPKYLEWLLDDSAFWTGAQKSRFIRKLWEMIDCLHKMDPEVLDTYMQRKYPDWEKHLILDDQSYEVMEYIKVEREAHFWRTRTRYVKEGPTKGITHIYRGCLEHYDSKTSVQNRIGKVKVSEIVDTMLPKGVCSELRKACEMYWWHTEDGVLVRDEQVDFLLSKKDF